MKRVLQCVLPILLMGVFPALVQATTWTLSGVTFSDGSVASGYFDLDSAGNVTRWNISVSGGADGNSVYTSQNSTPYDDAFVNFDFTSPYNPFYSNELQLRATVALLGTGTVALDTQSTSFESLPGVPAIREITGGLLVSAVPEPATWALMVGGLLLVARVARGRSQRLTA